MSKSKTIKRRHLKQEPSRTSRVVIATVSLLVIVLIGGSWVKEYLSLRKDGAQMDALQVELDEAHRRRSQILRIEKKLKRQLAEAQQRSVGPLDVESVREELIRIVRDSKASLRQLEIGDGETRSWSMVDDDPRNDTPPLYSDGSSFQLHKHLTQLQADGSIESIEQVIKEINRQGWLMSTKTLLISPTNTNEATASVEFAMVLYGLEPTPVQEEDDEENLAMHRQGRTVR